MRARHHTKGAVAAACRTNRGKAATHGAAHRSRAMWRGPNDSRERRDDDDDPLRAMFPNSERCMGRHRLALVGGGLDGGIGPAGLLRTRSDSGAPGTTPMQERASKS